MVRHKHFNRRFAPRHSARTCSYHPCNNPIAGVCRYCGKGFCREHLSAQIPSRPFIGVPGDDPYPIEGVHPCPNYVEAYEREKKKREEAERKAFSAFLDLPPSKPSQTVEPEQFPIKDDGKKPEYPTEVTPPSADSSWFADQFNILKRTFQNGVRKIRRNSWRITNSRILFSLLYLLVCLVLLEFVDYFPYLKNTKILHFPLELIVVLFLWLLIVKFAYDVLAGLFRIFRNFPVLKLIIIIVFLLAATYSLTAPENNPYSASKIVHMLDNLNFSVGPAVDLNKTYGDIQDSISNISFKIPGSIPIDKAWVDAFMLNVNSERQKNGLYPLTESSELNDFAQARFNTMVQNYKISHYGAGGYNVGEVVFYPEGFSPNEYVTDIKNTAPLHWNILVSPSLSAYGYHVETGPTIGIVGSCSNTEIPGPNIDVETFLQEQGCQTTTTISTWLVIDLS